jgi:NADPH2:quinone reductase
MTMRAFAVDGFGETGSVRDLPTPDPVEGQVLMRVRFAGVNAVDAFAVQGFAKDMIEHRFPLIPGVDASGTVEALGSGVEGWNVGDEVFGSAGKMYFGEGTFAELATAAGNTIAAKPSGLDHAQAAALPTAGATALTLLDAVGDDSEIILAIGAAGGVGSYLIQLGAHTGRHVIAVCRGVNAEYVRGLGAADVIDYTAGPVDEALRAAYPDGIDAIADMVGDQETVTRLSEQVRSGGTVASCAGGVDEDALADRDLTTANTMTLVTTENIATLARSLEDGTLKAPQIRSLPLDQAAEGLAEIAQRHVRGKLVVAIS